MKDESFPNLISITFGTVVLLEIKSTQVIPSLLFHKLSLGNKLRLGIGNKYLLSPESSTIQTCILCGWTTSFVIKDRSSDFPKSKAIAPNETLYANDTYMYQLLLNRRY